MIRPFLAALAVAALAALAACQSDAPPPLPPVGAAGEAADRAACDASGGHFNSTGAAHVCVHETRDAGKMCSRGTECEGVCLARSRTCAPIVPMLGCQEIFQDNGAPATQCIN